MSEAFFSLKYQTIALVLHKNSISTQILQIVLNTVATKVKSDWIIS